MALNPVGPLPASTYWRRRGVLVAAVVVLLLLLRSCSGGSSGRRDTLVSTSTSPTSAVVLAPTPTVAPNPSATPAVAGSGARPSPTAPAASGPAASGPAASGPAASGPAGTTAPGGAASAAPSAGAAGGTCPDRVLAVTATATQASYPVGARPLLTLTVRNTGTVACRRNLGSGAVGLLVTSGADRVWSSDDCSPGGALGPVLLAPGERQTTRVTWAGRRSAPGCAGSRAAVTAGTYRVVGRVGDLVRPGSAFVLAGG